MRLPGCLAAVPEMYFRGSETVYRGSGNDSRDSGHVCQDSGSVFKVQELSGQGSSGTVWRRSFRKSDYELIFSLLDPNFFLLCTKFL
jgi:hypothetical protein